MDKAARLQKWEPQFSQCELSSATYLCAPLHSETGNTILQFLYSASVPLGKAALVLSVFSLLPLPLPPCLHLILYLLFSSLFLTLKDQTFSVSLWSHITDEMTHGRKRQRGILLHGLKLNSHDVFCSVQHKP